MSRNSALSGVLEWPLLEVVMGQAETIADVEAAKRPRATA
jgi:hypothetical protein